VALCSDELLNVLLGSSHTWGQVGGRHVGQRCRGVVGEFGGVALLALWYHVRSCRPISYVFRYIELVIVVLHFLCGLLQVFALPLTYTTWCQEA